jgi:hypothetical protein
MSHIFLLYGAQAIVAGQIANYVKYPPRQKRGRKRAALRS